MIDIKIDFHDGAIAIEGIAIDHSMDLFLKTKEKFSLHFSEHKIKKSTVYRTEVADHYNTCFIESISIEYNLDAIKKVTINFINEEKNNNHFGKKTNILIFLIKITKIKPRKHGLSEVEFPFTWGRINLINDIKTSSSTLVLHYKNP